MTKMVRTWDVQGELQTIRGSKGGGSQRTPVESPDSLRSVAMARILDLVSEGEIYGFADQAKPLTCIFLNETPVANADGSLNFQNVQIDSRTGTQTQDYIKGFPSVENETLINTELTFDTPWTRGFTNTNLSAINVKIAVPMLTKTNTENGDIGGSSIEYVIELAVDGGPFSPVLNGRFTGKTTSKYVRGHRIDLPEAETGWTIRVRRLTADSTSSSLINETWIDSYTEIIDAKLRYPMSALVGTIVYAEQFSNIPSRAFHMKGRIIRVPSNYDPDTRTYTGVWDGTFQSRYSNNPAWVFYDLATNTRYGLGKYVTSELIDKWNLYRIAQYCDGMVSDGKGGLEPRFTCNVYLQTRNDATKVMQDLATVFRGIMYSTGGAITAVADMPETVDYTYSPSNVIDGKFVYGGSARTVRHTVALVSWNDMSDFGRAKVEYVEDEEGIARYGIQETAVIAVGCTSQAQARRFGKYILTTERWETQSTTFGVGLDGTLVAPGRLCAVADPVRAGRRMGGRISAATMTQITLDRFPEVDPVPGDKLSVNLPSGVLQERVVQSVDAANRRVTVTVAYSELPQAESQWLLERSDLVAQKFRVISVKERDDASGYTISALQHEDGKFAYVEDGIKIDNPPISALPGSVVPAPQNLQCVQREIRDENTASKVAMLTWDRVPTATSYNVQWRHNEGSWIDVGNNASNQREIYSIPLGPFEVQVIAINALGVRSLPTFGGPYDIVPLSIPPGFVDRIDEGLNDLDEALTQEVIDRSNAIAQEVIDRNAAIAVEAQARADAILAERLITEAAIENEATLRQTADESLASQINSIVAGSGEQFDGAEIWYFDTTAEGWTGFGGAVTVTQGWLKGPDGTDVGVISPNYVIDGAVYRSAKMRVKRTGTPTWDGRLYWRVGSDPWTTGNSIVLPEPAWDADNIMTLDFLDVPWPSNASSIRIDLLASQDATNYIEFDWIAVGRPAPGASMAALQEEAQARVTGDQAEATARQTLAAQMRGAYTGNDINALTQGLLYQERVARVGADNALASDITTLSARVTNAELDIDAQATATQALEGRVDVVEGDVTVNSNAITALNSRMGTAEGQISANSNAVQSLDTRVGNVESTVTAQATSITKLTSQMADLDRLLNNSFETAGAIATQVDQWGSGVGIAAMPTGVVRTTAAGVAYHGTAAVQFDGVAGGTYRPLWSWSRISAQPNDKIRLRIRHKSGSTSPNAGTSVNIEMYWINAAGGFISATPLTATVGGAYAYTMLEGVVTAPANTAYGYMRIVVGAQTAGSIIVDFAELSKETLTDQAQATALQTLETRVQTTETGVAANASAITSLNTTVAGKADVSAVVSLNTSVTQLQNQPTASGNLYPNSTFAVDDGAKHVWIWNGGNAPAVQLYRATGGTDAGYPYRSAGMIATTNGGNGNVGLWGMNAWLPGDFVQSGKYYIFSAYLSGQQGGLWVQWLDQNNTPLLEVYGAATAVAGGGRRLDDWTRVYMRVQAPANAVRIRVGFYFYSNPAGFTFQRMLYPMFEHVPDYQTQPSPYGQGGVEMFAAFTVRLDVSGYASGFQLFNDGTVSNFQILADYFVIAKPSGGMRTEYSNGNWRTYDNAGTLRTRMGIW